MDVNVFPGLAIPYGNIMAAIGVAQLKRDEISTRRQIGQRYNAKLGLWPALDR